MHPWNRVLVTTLMVCGMAAVPATANAWAFYWSKVEVKTSSWKNCMSFAHGAGQKKNLAQLKRDNLAVSGTLKGASATITCIGTGGNSKAIAVVMVVGDAEGPVKQLRDDLVTEITRMIIID